MEKTYVTNEKTEQAVKDLLIRHGAWIIGTKTEIGITVPVKNIEAFRKESLELLDSLPEVEEE